MSSTHRSTLAMLRDAELTKKGLSKGRAKVAIHVLEQPTAASDPAWPRPALVLIPAILIGAMLGLGTAWHDVPSPTFHTLLRAWTRWGASSASWSARSTMSGARC